MYLVDTHLLLWAAFEPDRLSTKAVEGRTHPVDARVALKCAALHVPNRCKDFSSVAAPPCAEQAPFAAVLCRASLSAVSAMLQTIRSECWSQHLSKMDKNVRLAPWNR